MGHTPATEYDAWLASLTVPQIERAFADLGCTHVLVKVMTGNQGNTKQQIYCGTDYSQTARIPMGDPSAFLGSSKKKDGNAGAIFRASVKLSWLQPHSMTPLPAPEAKLIYYPQYPEVRLSGFLRGCEDPPASLLSIDKRGKENRRTLLLGVSAHSSHVYALMLPPENPIIDALVARSSDTYGPFFLWSIGQAQSLHVDFYSDLSVVIETGPHDGVKLSSSGVPLPYQAPNAGGYTLEALLGVAPNGDPVPDYLGWEIKAHKVRSLDKPITVGRLTLMTPEPDGGVYVSQGVQRFLEKYGYQNTPERYDFAGTSTVGGAPNPRTGVTLQLLGYRSPKSFDPDGMVAAICDDTIIASWSFEKILAHWSRKHAKTAYIPYLRTPAGQYLYGRWCSFGEGTSFAHVLSAFATQKLFWDPGIKSVLSQTGKWKSKKRNQFRCKFQDLHLLYESFTTRDILN